MRILLDTHVFLWLQLTPDRLGEQRSLVEDESNELLVSAVSTWELAIKVGLGKLALPGPVLDFIARRARLVGAELVPISHEHAAGVARLPEIHRDPFDRLLVAQAIVEDATLLTADALLGRYGPSVRVIGA